MTQTAVTAQPGDVVVIVPRWLIRAIAFLSLFIGLSATFLLFLMGYTSEGLVLSIAMLALVPLGMLIQYLLWRFYWHLILIGLLVQCVLYGLALAGIATQSPSSNTDTLLASVLSLLSSVNLLSQLLALFLSALITFILYRIYALWQRARSPVTSTNGDDDMSLDFGRTMTLMERVVKKLEATGSQPKVEGATVQVYKSGQFIGIVRVIDRPIAISAANVEDVVKLRDRLGVKIAYIATIGHFQDDVRDLARKQGVRVMTL